MMHEVTFIPLGDGLHRESEGKYVSLLGLL